MEQQELYYKPEWYAVRWSNKNSTINQNGMLLDGATRTPLKPEWYATLVVPIVFRFFKFNEKL
jgi:hypothetical protein